MTVSSGSKLFRENALLHFISQDEMQQTLKIVSLSSWMWVSICLLLLLAFGIWLTVGEIKTTISVNGIVVPESQVQQAEKQVQENIKNKQDKVAALKSILDKKINLYKHHYLTTVELEKAKEEYMTAKEELTNQAKNDYIPINHVLFSKLISSSDESLVALVFVNHAEGKKIKIGAEAYLLPGMISAFQYGYIKGKVMSISDYPASKQSVYSYLGNTNLVDEFFSNGVPFVAKIQFIKNKTTKSGLLWTTKKGAPFSIEPGTTVLAQIVNKKCAPIQLLSKQGECA